MDTAFIVLITKYRFPLLKGIEYDQLDEFFKKSSKKQNVSYIRVYFFFKFKSALRFKWFIRKTCNLPYKMLYQNKTRQTLLKKACVIWVRYPAFINIRHFVKSSIVSMLAKRGVSPL